jgi:hypothetical protein
MPKGPKPPPAQSVETTLAQQQKAGVDAASSKLGMTPNSSSPIGSARLVQVGTNADGSPKYEYQSEYTPEQQALLDQLVGTKGTAGGAGSNLAQDAFSYLSEVPDFVGGANSLVQQATDRQLPYFERFQKPAREQLDTQLRNQGILPDTPAYHQQMDKLLAQQDLNTGNWMNTFEQQAFQQAKDQYNVPADMIAKLMSLGAPMDLNSSFMQNPDFQIQPGNAQQAADLKYKADMARYTHNQQYLQMMTNLGMTAAGAVLGGPAGSSMMSSMFAPMGSNIGTGVGNTIGPGGAYV